MYNIGLGRHISLLGDFTICILDGQRYQMARYLFSPGWSEANGIQFSLFNEKTLSDRGLQRLNQ